MFKLTLPAILFTLAATSATGEVAPSQEGHDLFHQYYKFWYNGRGTHCCNEQHCRPAKFRYHNGEWQVEVTPDYWYTWKETDEVIDDYGLDPFGSVCHSGTTVFCVDPPQAGI